MDYLRRECFRRSCAYLPASHTLHLNASNVNENTQCSLLFQWILNHWFWQFLIRTFNLLCKKNDVFTQRTRHGKQTGSLNWPQFTPQSFIGFSELVEFTEIPFHTGKNLHCILILVTADSGNVMQYIVYFSLLNLTDLVYQIYLLW